MQISGIYTYPVKSLRGIALNSSKIEVRGLQYDRRWMLVDENGTFLTQRTFPQMALLTTEIAAEHLVIRHATKSFESLQIPLQISNKSEERTVQIWRDTCKALTVSDIANEWLSEALETHCQLVYMPDDSLRPTDPTYSQPTDIVSFADGFPILLIGQASLDDLNTRLKTPIPMNRFRPNLVFTGGAPFAEDTWKNYFQIGNLRFRAAKPCVRCALPTVNQETAERGGEPLKTLSTYRLKGKDILFGMNVCWEVSETAAPMIRLGDQVIV